MASKLSYLCHLTLLLFLAFFPETASAAACTKALPSGQVVGGTYNVSIPSDGTSLAADGIATRSYLVFIPPAYATAASVPAIFSYHGGTKNASEQLGLDQMTHPEFNTNSMLIYPQGIGATWQGTPEISPRSDTDFTLSILSAIKETYCIDSAHVYATGKSDGGGFVNILACNASTSSQFAAFAPVSGAYYSGTPPCNASTLVFPCKPDRVEIPIIIFHGGNDKTISYEGSTAIPTGRKGECLPKLPHFVQEWAQRDGLATTNVTTLLPSAHPMDTLVYTFGDGSETGLVQHVFDPNIGHDWPSIAPNDDNTLNGHVLASFNATPIILEYFNGYSLP